MRLAKASFLSLFSVLLVSCLVSSVRSVGVHSYEFSRVGNVVSYITNRYNATMGLCSDSEDTGFYYGTWGTYSKLYFLYSDNLFAYHALSFFAPYWADKLKVGLDKYVYPRDTMGFGVLFGEDIPDQEHDAGETILQNNTDGSVLVYRRHCGAVISNWEVYADRVIYHALDQFRDGHKDAAFATFSIAVHMFNGFGLYDQGSLDAGWMANYKLGLLLYANWFMDYGMNNTVAVESAMWSAQNNVTGGIHTAMSFGGVPFGTSNIETSSMCILPYTLPLASGVVVGGGSGLPWYESPISVLMVAVCIIVFVALIKRKF